MTVPSGLALPYYGKEIVMISKWIPDHATNVLISYMVFVSDIKKTSKA